MRKIEKIAVIGSGVMGSGIAAQVANAGLPVLLFDIVGKDADRTSIAKGAVERMLKTDPAPLMHAKNARLITPCNLEDDLAKLAEVDWIVEVVIERLDIKKKVYETLEANRKQGSIISSNTSTIPLSVLAEGRSPEFRRDFCITHFFNPPRYMRLLEVVRGKDTADDVIATVADFGDRVLGKGVVACHDRPGFIANRIGTYWIQTALNAAFDQGVSVEEADAVMGKPLGIPKTGVFGLMDLIGIDLMPHIAKSLKENLPADDSYVLGDRPQPLVEEMIATGFTGRKGKGGFYRLNTEGGKKQKEAKNLKTGAYAPAGAKIDFPSLEAGRKGLRAVVESPDRGGKYAWAVLRDTLSYTAALVPEIADTVQAVDDAMVWGYAWKAGPFAMIDQLGAAWFAARLKEEGRPVPKLLALAAEKGGFYKLEGGKRHFLAVSGEYQPITRPDGVLLLEDIKLAAKPVEKNGSAALWNIGGGVLCLEFTSKMNAIDDQIFSMIDKAIALCRKKDPYQALVIYNEGSNFSVGANLGLAIFALNLALYPQIEQMISTGQGTYAKLKYAPFPVIGAPSGMALGGGCEILLHCAAIQAHAETYVGLVEVGVGLVPGWGGCKELITRAITNKKRPGGPMPAVSSVFESVGTAKVAKSAAEARDMLILRPNDGITMNRDRLLFDAKAKALKLLEEGYSAPEPIEINLPGASARLLLDQAVEDFARSGKATPHDVVVSKALARVITGGDTDIMDPVSEKQLLKLEQEEFMKLVHNEGTLKRIEHMLETGKPLRN